jgi:hypothetical protein
VPDEDTLRRERDSFRRIAVQAMRLMSDEQLAGLRLALDELDREALAAAASRARHPAQRRVQ